jgi:hypothetical protein
MSASTIDPAVTRLSNPALISDATAKAQIFGFVPARNFRVEISLEDSSANNPVLDLTSAVVEWKFTPVDPDDYVEDEAYASETEDESQISIDAVEVSDLEEALYSEPEDEDEDDDDESELLGLLDLTFLLSKDTLIQSALLRESACINTEIIISDNNGVPMMRHTFAGFIYPEDILPVGSSDVYADASGSFMTANVRIRIFDCTLWGLL